MSGAQLLDALRQATLAAPAAIESSNSESIEQAIQAIETASAAVQAVCSVSPRDSHVMTQSGQLRRISWIS